MQKKTFYKILIIIGIPLFITFDILYFLATRTTCLASSCLSITEFIKQSSLTVFLVSSSFVGLKFWKKN